MLGHEVKCLTCIIMQIMYFTEQKTVYKKLFFWVSTWIPWPIKGLNQVPELSEIVLGDSLINVLSTKADEILQDDYINDNGEGRGGG